MVACNKSDVVNAGSTVQKAPMRDVYLENFRLAINEMSQPQYFPTAEYTAMYGDELSPERKQILLQPAMDLVNSETGTTYSKMQKLTPALINKILNDAFGIYIKKTSKKVAL